MSVKRMLSAPKLSKEPFPKVYQLLKTYPRIQTNKRNSYSILLSGKVCKYPLRCQTCIVTKQACVRSPIAPQSSAPNGMGFYPCAACVGKGSKGCDVQGEGRRLEVDSVPDREELDRIFSKEPGSRWCTQTIEIVPQQKFPVYEAIVKDMMVMEIPDHFDYLLIDSEDASATKLSSTTQKTSTTLTPSGSGASHHPTPTSYVKNQPIPLASGISPAPHRPAAHTPIFTKQPTTGAPNPAQLPHPGSGWKSTPPTPARKEPRASVQSPTTLKSMPQRHPPPHREGIPTPPTSRFAQSSERSGGMGPTTIPYAAPGTETMALPVGRGSTGSGGGSSDLGGDASSPRLGSEEGEKGESEAGESEEGESAVGERGESGYLAGGKNLNDDESSLRSRKYSNMAPPSSKPLNPYSTPFTPASASRKHTTRTTSGPNQNTDATPVVSSPENANATAAAREAPWYGPIGAGGRQVARREEPATGKPASVKRHASTQRGARGALGGGWNGRGGRFATPPKPRASVRAVTTTGAPTTSSGLPFSGNPLGMTPRAIKAPGSPTKPRSSSQPVNPLTPASRVLSSTQSLRHTPPEVTPPSSKKEKLDPEMLMDDGVGETMAMFVPQHLRVSGVEAVIPVTGGESGEDGNRRTGESVADQGEGGGRMRSDRGVLAVAGERMAVGAGKNKTNAIDQKKDDIPEVLPNGWITWKGTIYCPAPPASDKIPDIAGSAHPLPLPSSPTRGISPISGNTPLRTKLNIRNFVVDKKFAQGSGIQRGVYDSVVKKVRCVTAKSAITGWHQSITRKAVIWDGRGFYLATRADAAVAREDGKATSKGKGKVKVQEKVEVEEDGDGEGDEEWDSSQDAEGETDREDGGSIGVAAPQPTASDVSTRSSVTRFTGDTTTTKASATAVDSSDVNAPAPSASNLDLLAAFASSLLEETAGQASGDPITADDASIGVSADEGGRTAGEGEKDGGGEGGGGGGGGGK